MPLEATPPSLLASWAQTLLSAPNPDFSPLSFSVDGMMPTVSFPWPSPSPLFSGVPTAGKADLSLALILEQPPTTTHQPGDSEEHTSRR